MSPPVSQNRQQQTRFINVSSTKAKAKALSSGKSSRGKAHRNPSKSTSSSNKNLPCLWSKFRVVLSKSGPATSTAISYTTSTGVCSCSRGHADHDRTCKTAKADPMAKQPTRVNAAVFDPFNQTTLPEAHESFRVINFYMSYAQSCPATTSVISSALKEPACLYAMLAYVSVVMDRLNIIEDTTNFVEYYSGKSLVHIRQDLSGIAKEYEPCVQAIMWLCAAAILQENHNVSRMHLSGIKALLRQNEAKIISGEVAEAIMFCDYFCSISNLESLLFPDASTLTYVPRYIPPLDSAPMKCYPRAAIEQVDGDLSYLMEGFVSCAQEWLNTSNTWDQSPRLREMICSSCHIRQEALHKVLDPQPQHPDHYTVCMMILLGCLLLLVPINGIGVFGKGFQPLFSKGIFPTFSTHAFEGVATKAERVKGSLQLWNDNIAFFRETQTGIEDLDWFIFKVTLPVRVLAGDRYNAFPRFLEDYLRQQAHYPINSAATLNDEASFKLREKLYGSSYAKYPILDIL